MLDLETEIVAWRREMTGAGFKPGNTLDELELHLRDAVNEYLEDGVDLREAWARARKKLGTPAELRPEFDKIRDTRKPRRAAFMGFLGLILVVVLFVCFLNMDAANYGTTAFYGALGFLTAILALIAWTSFHVGRWREQAIRETGGPRMLRPMLPAVATFSLLSGSVVAVAATSSIWSVLVGVPLALIVLASGGMRAGLSKGQRAGSPRAGWWMLALLGPVACGAWITYMFAGPGYYHEFDRVKAELARLPAVEVVEINFNRDIDLENIYAELHFKGKGPLELFNLTPASFAEAPNLAVGRIGPYSFRHSHWRYGRVIDRHGQPVGSRSDGWTLDFGPRGDFAPDGRFLGLLAVELRTVQDLIAHYDEICAVLDRLASEPQPLAFTDPDGSYHEYTIRR